MDSPDDSLAIACAAERTTCDSCSTYALHASLTILRIVVPRAAASIDKDRSMTSVVGTWMVAIVSPTSTSDASVTCGRSVLLSAMVPADARYSSCGTL